MSRFERLGRTLALAGALTGIMGAEANAAQSKNSSEKPHAASTRHDMDHSGGVEQNHNKIHQTQAALEKRILASLQFSDVKKQRAFEQKLSKALEDTFSDPEVASSVGKAELDKAIFEKYVDIAVTKGFGQLKGHQSEDRRVKTKFAEKELHYNGNLVLENQPDLSHCKLVGKNGEYKVGDNFVAYQVPFRSIRSLSLAEDSAAARLRSFVVQEGFVTSNVPQFMNVGNERYVYMGIQK